VALWKRYNCQNTHSKTISIQCFIQFFTLWTFKPPPPLKSCAALLYLVHITDTESFVLSFSHTQSSSQLLRKCSFCSRRRVKKKRRVIAGARYYNSCSWWGKVLFSLHIFSFYFHQIQKSGSRRLWPRDINRFVCVVVASRDFRFALFTQCLLVDLFYSFFFLIYRPPSSTSSCIQPVSLVTVVD